MNNFWEKLKKPIFVLAPMADVTDCAFRKIINKYGKPDVFWTEFVSADGLAHPVAREKLLIDLKFEKGEHPIVAQIFGGRPENIREAAKLCALLGFDGVDLNMGCPDKSIEKQNSGAGCIKNPKLAIEVIRAAKEGAMSASGRIPVSVKTRIGYNKEEIDTWIAGLLAEKLPVLTVHLRTRKEMSLVPAHWELMPRIIELRNKISPETLIIGNGDVVDLKDAEEKVKKYGCDGVMLGRAIFGNPWLFAKSEKASLEKHKNFLLKILSVRRRHSYQGFSQELSPTLHHKLEVMIEHTKLFEEMLGKHKNFAIMKKHYKAYVNGFDGAKELRVKLMEAENADEVEKITNDFLKTF
ncbi:MAG: tRNA-dihydrouridine synthase [Patescibacteria group bacterium]